MASGYQTSNGVDLDSRYLGINAKAKSAATADVATSAQTVTSLVGATPVISIPQVPVEINTRSSIALNKSWKAPSNGLLVGNIYYYGHSTQKAYIKLRGEYIIQGNDPGGIQVSWALKKDDIIETSAWRANESSPHGIVAKFYPWGFL